MLVKAWSDPSASNDSQVTFEPNLGQYVLSAALEADDLAHGGIEGFVGRELRPLQASSHRCLRIKWAYERYDID